MARKTVTLASTASKVLLEPTEERDIKLVGWTLRVPGATEAKVNFRDSKDNSGPIVAEVTIAGKGTSDFTFTVGNEPPISSGNLYLETDQNVEGDVYLILKDATPAYYPNETHSRPSNAKDNALFEALPGGGAG